MKINKILILVIIFLNNYCIVQAQSFEKDWQWLRFAETTAGTASSVYENALLNLVANNLKDSLMTYALFLKQSVFIFLRDSI